MNGRQRLAGLVAILSFLVMVPELFAQASSGITGVVRDASGGVLPGVNVEAESPALIEKVRDGKATSLGAASGVVAGLVAITPACGAVSPIGAIALGLVAGGICALAVGLKYRFGYDDSLDVVGVHLVGGLVGTIGVGFLSTSTGLLYGEGASQLVLQVLVALVAILWAAAATFVVASIVKLVIGLRLPEEDEIEGIDFVEHGESAYDLSPAAGGRRAGSPLAPSTGVLDTPAAAKEEANA